MLIAVSIAALVSLFKLFRSVFDFCIKIPPLAIGRKKVKYAFFEPYEAGCKTETALEFSKIRPQDNSPSLRHYRLELYSSNFVVFPQDHYIIIFPNVNRI